MKSNQKRIFGLLASIVVVFLIAYVSVTQYYNKDRVKAEVEGLLEEMLPESDVAIEDIDINYGPSLVVKGKSMTSHYFEVDSFTLRLPIISLIAGGGNVEVLLRNSTLRLNSKDSKKKSSSKEVTVPSFLANSSGSFRFENLTIIYKDDSSKKDQEKKFLIDRFILKNIGLRSNAAFEIKSKVAWENKRTTFDTNLYIIGSFNVAQYIQKKKLPFNANFKLNDIAINGNKGVLTTVNGRLGFSLDSEGVMVGGAEAFHQNSNIQLEGKFGNNTLDLKKISFHLEGNELAPLSKAILEVNQPKKALVDGVGKLLWSESRFEPDMNLTFSSLMMPYGTGMSPLSGEFKGNHREFSLYAYGPMGEGKINLETKAEFNKTTEESFHKLVSSLNINLIFDDATIETASLFKDFPLKKLTRDEEGNYVLLPPVTINIEAKNSLLKGIPVEGFIKIEAREDKIKASGKGNLWNFSENIKVKSSGLYRKNKKLETSTIKSLFFKDKLWKEK